MKKTVMKNAYDHFYLPTDGSPWIKGPNGELLLYVPEEYRESIQHPPCILRISEKLVTVDFRDTVSGEDWARCYTPAHQDQYPQTHAQ